MMTTRSAPWYHVYTTDHQDRLIRGTIEGKLVYDLGCGISDSPTRLVEDWGAASVIAVDRDPAAEAAHSDNEDPRIHFEGTDFCCMTAPYPDSVVFVGCPENRSNPDLMWLLGKAETVVYLGINNDNTMCGHQDLLDLFLERELLAYEECHYYRDLIILGSPLRSPRDMTNHERRLLDALRRPARNWEYTHEK